MESRPTRHQRRHAAGYRTTLTEPDGYSYTFGYDELNQCIRLRDPNANVITLQYDTAGQRTTLLDSSGLTRAYAYDPAGRLTTQIDYNGATPIGTFVDSYDAVGVRTGRVQDGTAVSWTYDAIYRLTGQTKSGQAATFSYDPGGNLLTKHHEGSNPLTMAYDAANRLTTSLLGATQLTTYTYSNAGEMTGERCNQLGVLSTFVYDGEHRCLNELRASGANHTYAYGSDGFRRSAHMAGTASATTFIWDGTDVLNEYVNGALSTRYDVLDGEVIAEKRGANRYVYGVDPLGSVAHLLDSGLNRTATYTYWPYGEVQAHTGADTPMQFVGGLGYYTGVANRVYVRARDYRPDLGRWVTEDPIGFAGGDWNVYGYVRGTVLSLVDPRGTYPRSRCVSNPRRQREMEEAAERMCRQLESAGRDLLEQSQCLTGPKQVQCLLDWCRHGSLNCGDRALCNGRCAYVQPPRGCRFRTDGTVYICPGAWTDGMCWSGHPACNTIGLEPMILHEAIHLCGSGQHGGPPSGDAAGNRANCLCAAHLVHRAL